jgi:hypothetical protein
VPKPARDRAPLELDKGGALQERGGIRPGEPLLKQPQWGSRIVSLQYQRFRAEIGKLLTQGLTSTCCRP